MKYIVITSKHHDGFAMFDTKATDWNIVKATPFGRDPLKELAAACRKYGIKLGFYYSQAQDWNQRRRRGAAANGIRRRNTTWTITLTKSPCRRFSELLSNYGEFPAVLWWDTPIDMNRERAAKLIATAQVEARHHSQQPAWRRFQRRHRNAGATHSRNRISGARLGNVHDDERHVGLQEL